MGAIANEIAAIWADNTLSGTDKRRKEAKVRADKLTATAPAVGTTLTWGVYSFTLSEAITSVNNMVRIVGTLKKNGVVVPLNFPLYFANPPYTVTTTNTSAEYVRNNPDGSTTYIEENPRQALLEVIKNFVSQF